MSCNSTTNSCNCNEITLPVGAKGNTGATGATGDDGADGVSIAELFIFRRSGSPLSAPTGGSFDFGTQTFTEPNLWYQAPPAGANPCYISKAVAVGITPTTVDSTLTWSTPVIVFENGADGAAGAAGSNGSNGTDGVNGTSILYSVFTERTNATDTSGNIVAFSDPITKAITIPTNALITDGDYIEINGIYSTLSTGVGTGSSIKIMANSETLFLLNTIGEDSNAYIFNVNIKIVRTGVITAFDGFLRAYITYSYCQNSPFPSELTSNMNAIIDFTALAGSLTITSSLAQHTINAVTCHSFIINNFIQ